MKKVIGFCVSVFLTFSLHGQVTGYWKAVEDTDTIPRSIVRIYEQNGKLYGEIEKLLPAAKITRCTGCKGDMKNASLVGMTILYDMKATPTGGTDGKIFDPYTGESYSCYIELVSPDRLKVRGYMGFSALGKTMYWNRLK